SYRTKATYARTFQNLTASTNERGLISPLNERQPTAGTVAGPKGIAVVDFSDIAVNEWKERSPIYATLA
ncbi:MAG: hypothetical protein ABJ015_15725, partial [Rhodopirellula bahusiensis]